jgi:AAA family ATP:ADP antiporter
MGAEGGTNELPHLFLITFLVMLAAVPAYSALVAKLPRRWVVRVVYHFFCLCLVLLWASMQYGTTPVKLWTARVFFVWVNVFGLYATSVFWSVLTDIFSNQQAKRLFGLVAAGGTIGAISGSLLTSVLTSYLSIGWLMLLPIVLLQLGLWCAWRLERNAVAATGRIKEPTQNESRTSNGISPTDREDEQPTGGGLLSGITQVLRSPYLATICLYLFLVQAFGTQLYFQQASIVADAFSTKEDRTQWFAYLDLATQLLTLVIQGALASTVLRRLGVGVALALLPVVYAVGLGALAIDPSLMVLSVTMIATRASAYGITVPAREVLFTVVSREQKYKSKSFIDTVVLRGGDAIAGQLFRIIRWTGIGPTQMNLLAMPLILGWIAVAYGLGRSQQRLAAKKAGQP